MPPECAVSSAGMAWFRSSEIGDRRSEFGDRSSEIGVRSSDFGSWNAECGMRNRQSAIGNRQRANVRTARCYVLLGDRVPRENWDNENALSTPFYSRERACAYHSHYPQFGRPAATYKSRCRTLRETAPGSTPVSGVGLGVPPKTFARAASLPPSAFRNPMLDTTRRGGMAQSHVMFPPTPGLSFPAPVRRSSPPVQPRSPRGFGASGRGRICSRRG